MKTSNDDAKQVTSADVEGFINMLTLLLEGNRLSDSTKEPLRQMLCNTENTAGEGKITSPENIRAWLANVLNDEAIQADEDNAFVTFQDKAETQRAVDSILRRITEQGLHDLANILVKLRELTGESSDKSKKASEEIDRILELVFRHSRSYHQALRLYANRFDITGGGDPDDHINDLADRLLKGEEVTDVEP
jgi:ferritin-like protein